MPGGPASSSQPLRGRVNQAVEQAVEAARQHRLHAFDGAWDRWAVLGAGLFQGKIRAVVSTLGPRSRGVRTEKVIIKPGQMKLFYVLEGKVAPHGWENLGARKAQALWVILG